MTSRLTRLGQIWPPVLEANSGPKWWVATTRIPSSVLRVAAHGKRAAFFGRLLRPAEGGLPPILTPVGRGPVGCIVANTPLDIECVCCRDDIVEMISIKCRKGKHSRGTRL